MADELDPVEQRFIAEIEDYVDEVRRAADDARDFADSNEEAKIAVDGLRDHAIEAGEALGHVRDESLEASASVKELGDSADETAAKLDLMGLSGAGTATSLAPLLGVIGAIVIAAAAVAPAVSAMGLGFASFGMFALPTIMQVSSGLQQINTDMNAVQSATTAAAKNKAIAQLNHDWAGMPAPIAAAVKELLAFKNEFESLAQKSGIQADILGDLSKGLQIARQVLPELIPLAQAGARAFSGMLTTIGQGLESSGFKNFLQVMTSMVVPATQAITHLAMTILGVLGSALEQLAPLSVPFIRFVDVLIGALGGPATAALKAVISLFLGLGQALEPLLPGLSQVATLLISDIGSSFAAFIPVIRQVVQIIGGSLITILRDLEPVIANTFTPNGPFMLALEQLPALLSAILPLFRALAVVFSDPHVAQLTVWVISLIVAWKSFVAVVSIVRTAMMALMASMAANPVTLLLIALAALVVGLIYLWDHCKAFRDFWIDLWHDITRIVDDAVDWIRGHWKLILAILAGPVAAAAYLIVTHWHDIVRGAEIMWHAVVGFFERLPGDILHAVGDLGRLLWNAGAAVINGLWNGIKSVVGPVLNFISGLGNDISSVFSSALSILSPSRVFYQHGVNTLLGYINGVKATAPQLLAAMRGLGGQVAGGGIGLGTSGGGAYGVAGGRVNVTVPLSVAFGTGTSGLNDPRFLQYVQQVLQEAVLRYAMNNPGNGLTPAWRLG